MEPSESSNELSGNVGGGGGHGNRDNGNGGSAGGSAGGSDFGGSSSRGYGDRSNDRDVNGTTDKSGGQGGKASGGYGSGGSSTSSNSSSSGGGEEGCGGRGSDSGSFGGERQGVRGAGVVSSVAAEIEGDSGRRGVLAYGCDRVRASKASVRDRSGNTTATNALGHSPAGVKSQCDENRSSCVASAAVGGLVPAVIPVEVGPVARETPGSGMSGKEGGTPAKRRRKSGDGTRENLVVPNE